jgi:hypothetical protein
MSLTAAFAALALSTAPVPQADTLADLRPEDRADVQCMAMILFLIGSKDDDAARAPLTAGATYYYGRLQGRSPGTDWVNRVMAYVRTEPLEDLEANRSRCATEMRTMGAIFVAAGAAAQGG